MFKYKLTDNEKNIDYKILCTTPKDYELALTFHSKTELMKYLFKKSKNALRRKKGIDIQEQDPESIKSFDVPKEYYKFLKISIRTSFYSVTNEFKKDGIIILSYNIDRVRFTLNKTTNLYDIMFNITGIYTKKSKGVKCT